MFKQNSENVSLIRTLLNETNPELLRITLQLLITLDDDKQSLILTDIENLYRQNLGSKNKEMFACNEFLKLFMHKNKGIEIRRN